MTDLTRLQSRQDPVADMATRILEAKAGNAPEGIVLLDAQSGPALLLPDQTKVDFVTSFGNDLILVQPDKTATVVVNGMLSDLLLVVDGTQVPAAQLQLVANDLRLEAQARGAGEEEVDSLLYALEKLAPWSSSSSIEPAEAVTVTPLVGLEINPLLQYTEYEFPERREDEFGVAEREDGAPPGLVTLTVLGDAALEETDDDLPFVPAQAVLPTIPDPSTGEVIETVSFRMTGLPADTVVTAGTLTAGPDGLLTLTFSGTLAAYSALTVIFPEDFSTANRSDVPGRPITASLQASSNYGATGVLTFPVTIDIESDVAVSAPPRVTGTEDDLSGDGSGSVVALGIDVVIDDNDGSEDAATVTVTFTDLPAGSYARVNGTDTPIVGAVWQGTPAEAEALSLGVPGDFSGTVGVTITATSPEGVAVTRQDVVIAPAPDIEISAPPQILAETDAAVVLSPGSVWIVSQSDADGSEFITDITLTLSNLPDGMAISGVPAAQYGFDSATGAFTFFGSPAQYAALQLVFPADFSTTARNDGRGPISGSLTARSNEGDGPVEPVSVEITAEGDVEIRISAQPDLEETDAVVTFRPADYLTPVVTVTGAGAVGDNLDADGSESLATLVLTITGLPTDAAFTAGNVTANGAPLAGGALSVDPLTGASVFTATLTGPDVALYDQIEVALPADFSTTNRNDLTNATTAQPIEVTLRAITDEDTGSGLPSDGDRTESATLEVRDTHDITLVAEDPAPVSEDATGAGVQVDPDIRITVDDRDASEDPTTAAGPFGTEVTIRFTGLPPSGAQAVLPSGPVAVDDTITLSLTVADAEALQMLFPEGFAGTVDLDVTVRTPEGVVSDPLSIVVNAVENIEITAPPIVETETNAPVGITPSDTWQINITDPDGSEVVENVTITLSNLPAGMVVEGIPDTSFTYDPATGEFGFSGSEALYAQLKLTFPADFSSTSRSDGRGAIEGQIVVASNEGTDSAPLSITINETPDLDFSGPGTITVTETDDPIDIAPAALLVPFQTDIDGSETVDLVELTLPDLPPGTEISTDGGATFGLLGNATLAFSGSLADYQALVIRLPADFSTTNPVNPLLATLRATTDEGGDDTRTLDLVVEFSKDIDLAAPVLIQGQEDGGVANSTQGVVVDLEIAAAITDIDGSEDAATVTVTFTDLPTGAFARINGVDTPISAGQWTGTVAEVNALELGLPGDYSGRIPLTVEVVTPEGSELIPQVVIIDPSPDILIDGEVVVTEGDPVPGIPGLEIPLASFISIDITDPNETLTSLSFTLDGLPDGTQLVDSTGTPYGTFTPGAAGIVDLTYTFTAGTDPEDPADLILVLPHDYSTENPGTTLVATINVVSSGGSASGDVPFTVNAEGDIALDGSRLVSLSETDDPITFMPVDALVARATDLDGSESIDRYVVDFSDLPAGTRVSLDAGNTFTSLPVPPGQSVVSYSATLSPAQYANLTIELPRDFSTENPATTLTGTVTAITDEARDVGGIATGVATDAITVNVAAEGDVELIVQADVLLSENDAPGNTDDDDTTTDPVLFVPKDALLAAPTDADQSENIDRVDFRLTELPVGTELSRDGGKTFASIPAGTFFETDLTLAQYEDLVVRLPDEFSTESPATSIVGTGTFRTDEGGTVEGSFTVTVTQEGDIDLTSMDADAVEDQAAPIPLGLDAQITDPDGSELLGTITLSFAGLPMGDVTLSDGTNTYVVTAATPGFTISQADLPNLEITSVPEHFSGILTGTLNATSTENADVRQNFEVRIAPVAEPVITLFVDETEPQVAVLGADQYSVKEDTSFLLRIEAATPDNTDGSESLRTITVDNVPTAWLPQGDVGGFFELGAGSIQSATVSGTTLTITLLPDVTAFSGGVRLSMQANDDRDVATLQGARDLTATVTSVDVAAGLPDAVATATDSTIVAIDAVVDDATIDVRDRSTSENTNGSRGSRLGLQTLSLDDADGSETFDRAELTLTVSTTATTGFDLTDPAQADILRLQFPGGVSGDVSLMETGRTESSISYEILRPAAVSSADFAHALTDARVVVGQHFSGVIDTAGRVFWSETTTGDVEADTSDNFASKPFTTVVTFRPVAEADVSVTAFVRSPDQVADASPTLISGTAADGSTVVRDVLTLLESTADGSGPGQVALFLGLDLDTPDTDGSETLTDVTIANINPDWIADDLNGTTVLQSAFFDPSGAGPIDAAEWARVSGATFDAATGTLTMSFVPGTVSFDAAVVLRPTLYEDFDVDTTGDYADPATDPGLTSAGTFFNDDLRVTLRTEDSNGSTSDVEDAGVTLDVDVDPINNTVTILPIAVAREDVVDGAGGIVQAALIAELTDQDGSESVLAILLRRLDGNLVPYVDNPNDPGGPKIPALLQAVNRDGTNNWAIDVGPDAASPTWSSLELRGVETHFAGDISMRLDVVTRERDGGEIRVSQVRADVTILPVPDGGDPSETFRTLEDTAIAVVFDGNLIDNPGNSPGSPESLVDSITITGIVPDADGRKPRFFEGAPVADPATPGGFLNELVPDAAGSLTVSPLTAANLHVLPPEDSNLTISLPIEVTYREDLDPSQTLDAIGILTIRVTGVADTPIVETQNPDPAADPSGIDPTLINADFRPADDLQPGPADDTGILNAARAYAYAGYEGTPFTLTQRVSDAVLQNGLPANPDNAIFTAATPLNGERSESDAPSSGGADGSETIYYILTGFTPGIQVIGANPLDPLGQSYLVTQSQLSTLQIDAANTTGEKVAYHDLELIVIVEESDAVLPDLRGLSTQERLDRLNASDGFAVVQDKVGLMIIDRGDGTGGGEACPPGSPQDIGLPVLALTGTGDEDSDIPLTLTLTPNGTYNSLQDLLTLPNGVTGSLSIVVDLPPGASLSSTPPGAALLNPITGEYVIDLAKLIQPGDTTTSSGALDYRPPLHQSSPVNPFDPAETFGDTDPYDNLPSPQITAALQNASCNTSESGSVTSTIIVNPVADGPSVAIRGPNTVLEDEPFTLDVDITGIDPGERLDPVAPIVVEVDARNGGRLLDAAGNDITPVGTSSDGFAIYHITAGDLDTVQIAANEHYSGPLSYRVTATSQDIDFTSASSTASKTIEIIAVADTPTFDSTPPGPNPLYTAIEDQPFDLSSVLQGNSPDMDGSEIVTLVLSNVPDSLIVSGPGVTNNGDGSFTIPQSSYASLRLQLADEHARTPDSLDPSLPSQIPLTLTVNTLELSNSDAADASFDFFLQVIPDADIPTVTTASAAPTAVAEDDGTPIDLTLEASTPDPRETIDFVLGNLPVGTVVSVGGAPTIVTGSSILVPGTLTSAAGASPAVFVPDGTVSITPPTDFSGPLDIDVQARTTDADGAVTDTALSPTTTLNVTVTATSDLTVDVIAVDEVITETDAPLTYVPADNFVLSVDDQDGSESIETVSYTLTGLPDTATLGAGSIGATLSGGTLAFFGTEADFDALSIVFAADFSTQGAADMSGSITVATNEGDPVTETFTLAIDGELDLILTVTPTDQAQTGAPITVPLGVDAMITDSQPVPTETLEDVTITFDAPLDASLTPTAPQPFVLSADRRTLTMTRQPGTSSPDFIAAVAALALSATGAFAGTVTGQVTARTSDGALDTPVALSVSVNDQPVVSGPVDLGQEDTTVFTVPIAAFLANTTDPDTPLSISNLMPDSPDVTASIGATDVTFTVANGFAGVLGMTFDVTDAGTPAASVQATASIDIAQVVLLTQRGAETVTDPDGNGSFALLDDSTAGAAGQRDIGEGSAANEAVDYGALLARGVANPYAEFDGFRLLGGDDVISLAGASGGFTLDGGDGNDWLLGGDGVDTLTGGSGLDRFDAGDALPALPDVITDYESGEVIDLTGLITLAAGETIADRAELISGTLRITDTAGGSHDVFEVTQSGGGVPGSVTVAFEDAANAQMVATI